MYGRKGAFFGTKKDGKARFQHPLSPSVRTWHLSPFKICELVDAPIENDLEQKKKKDVPKKNTSNNESTLPLM